MFWQNTRIISQNTETFFCIYQQDTQKELYIQNKCYLCTLYNM